MTPAPCDTFGRWHRWHTVEVVSDRRDARAGHALRVLRCERCGTLSWRWAPVPEGSSSDPSRPAEGPASATLPKRGVPVRAVPRPAAG